jgi:ppGpp synthetase/RelA/SpoT-type nucleotidyltranferase
LHGISTALIVALVMGAFTYLQQLRENHRDVEDHQIILQHFITPLVPKIEKAADLSEIRTLLEDFQTAVSLRGHAHLVLELKDQAGNSVVASRPFRRRKGGSVVLFQSLPVQSHLLPDGQGSLAAWEDDALLGTVAMRRWFDWLIDNVLMALVILVALLVSNEFLVIRPLRRVLNTLRLLSRGYAGPAKPGGRVREWHLLMTGIQKLEQDLEETARRLLEAEHHALAGIAPIPVERAQKADDPSNPWPGTIPASSGVRPPDEIMLQYLKDKCRILETQDPMDPVVQRYAREVWEKDVIQAEIMKEMALRACLDNQAFRILFPDNHARVTRHLESLLRRHMSQLRTCEAELRQAIEEQGVPLLELQVRVKHAAGIFRKMQSEGAELEQIKDVFGFRVIVQDTVHCYQALAAVHQRFKAFPLRFKDYIAAPKANGYQSLHTYVAASDGLSFEIQIRSVAMDRQADAGDSAHWLYKKEQQNRSALVNRQLARWLSPLFPRRQ